MLSISWLRTRILFLGTKVAARSTGVGTLALTLLLQAARFRFRIVYTILVVAPVIGATRLTQLSAQAFTFTDTPAAWVRLVATMRSAL